MARFRLSVRAELDLLEIAEYTQRTWDDEQCARYRRDGEDIVIVRILHDRMLPDLHLLDDEEG
jgi:plasmid stabilization system protein ParE